MLKEFYDSSQEIFIFLAIQIMEVPEHMNDEMVHDIAFLLDMTAYLSELHLKLQAENHLVLQL
jgi:hypothetical protein